jgi:DNA processing protein
MPLECSEASALHWLRKALLPSSPADLARQCLDWAAMPGHHLLTQDDARYPALLLETSAPPPVLFARGRLELLGRESLAIVGSRNATPGGRRDAERFAADLSARGLCIVSGLAVGIDTAAHRGGLAHAGSSIAVLGTGPDVTYPAENAGLESELATKGCIITEFPVGVAPHAVNFPKRNRLISGLARGVLVVEAALKSGSLITAYRALRQNREVFAIPGSIHAPLSKGCHALLRDGAKLVECVEHIVEEFPDWPGAGPTTFATTRGGPPDPFLDAMGFGPVTMDAVVRLTGLEAPVSAARLAHFEIEGRVERLGGGLYQRKP